MVHFQNILKCLVFSLLSLVLLNACKGVKTVTGGKVDPGMPVERIIENHYAHQSHFQTLSGSLKIDYSKGKESQGVSVNFRMEKDKVIWMTAPFGMVKAYLTPEKVLFYNKLERHYFEGDYGYLSDLLGTELDFYGVQNLMLGNGVFDLRKEKYTSAVAQGVYQLKPEKAGELFKIVFELEPKNFKMASQKISQPWKNRRWEAHYTYQNISGVIFPDQLQIVATGQDNLTAIAFRFRNLELNQPLSFPYTVPEGFDRIIIQY